MGANADDFELGEGVYSFPQAARIITRAGEGATVRQLRYWIRTGLTDARLRTRYGLALSFHDVVSLEIVRRFKREGLTLQAIRKLEARMREQYPNLERPFAHRLFFTNGHTTWLADNPANPGNLVEEIVGAHPGHLSWTDAIRSFASEIHFDDQGVAVTWHLSAWVEANPAVQFGAPVVAGTRTPASTILANLEAGTPAQVADWYGLTVEQVEGVRAYFAAA